MVTTQALPHWDMSVVYPGLDSPEFDAGFKAVISSVNHLGDLFDDLGIALREPSPLTGETVSTFDRAMKQYNEVLEGVGTMSAYINAFFATDSRNDLAQAKLSELQQQLVRLSQLATRFTAWIGSLDVDALLADRSEAREHAFVLRQAQIARLAPDVAAEEAPGRRAERDRRHRPGASCTTTSPRSSSCPWSGTARRRACR